jgi:hypothetical protein
MADPVSDNEDLIFDEDEQEDSPIIITEGSRQVFSKSPNLSIRELYEQYQDGDLILQPDFQREFVWDAKKINRLIESVFLNFPIPVIYLAEEEDGTRTVIDGQQRLHSFFKFLDGDHRLKNLAIFTELNGKTYPELSKEYQSKFKKSTMQIVLIEKESQKDIRFEIFERLNTGSVKLNDQEIRNCTYRGGYNDLLKELAENKDFQYILDNSNLHTRMLDAELILRFFAFYHKTYLKYKSPMKQFLNDEIRQHKQLTQKEIEELRVVLKNSVDLIKTIFDNKAFRRMASGNERDPNGGYKETKFNKGLFDVLMNGFTDYKKPQVIPYTDAIREELLWLSANEKEFIDVISGTGTDSTEKIQKKFEIWRRALKNILGHPRNEPRCFSWELKSQLFKNNPVCAICNQRIMSVDDSEIDHIDFYWRGGETIHSNARLTHRFCNRHRGARGTTVIEQVTTSQPIIQNLPSHTDNLLEESQSLDTLNNPLKSHISESSSLGGNSIIRSPRPVNVSENILKPKYTKIHGATSRKKYIFPILEYLVLNNGSITNDVAFHLIESKFRNYFKPIDNEFLRDGKTRRWEENVDWAKTHMKASGMLTQDTRREWKITKYGEECYTKLKENPLIQIVISGGIISFQNP